MGAQKELDLDGRDCVSWLPDELLLIILSKLDLSNGARTTILSTRWRNLWTFPTSTVLKFDASDMILDTEYFRRYRQHVAMNMKLELIVDQTLAHYTGDVIDELNISYVPSYFDTPIIGLRKPWAKVDTWVEFAKQKQVKTLSLSFELFDSSQLPPYKPSPLKSLTSTTLFSLVTLRLKSPPEFSGKTIGRLVSSFPNLEELSIAKVDYSNMGFVVIEGSSLKLKHLEFIDLRFLGLRISAPNLLSFNFINCKILFSKIRLRQVPLLTQLSYEYDYLGCEVDPFIYKRFLFFENKRAHFPPEMKNLKQLKFTLAKHMDNALHVFFRLLSASPSLYKLWLNLGVIECPLIQNHKFSVNKCLEEVEIDGFTGSDNEVQLVMCITRFSPSLKKIVFRSSLSKFFKSQDAVIYTGQNYVASVVESLQSKLPQLELVLKCCSVVANQSFCNWRW